MKKFTFTIKGRQYEVDILNVDKDLVELEVNGSHYTVEMKREVAESKTPKLMRPPMPPPRPEEANIAHTDEGKLYPVKTPLPGTVLKILALPDMAVKPGDTLLIMEAMKMENNIYAEKKGVVRAVKVKEGDSVLQNDVLFLME